MTYKTGTINADAAKHLVDLISADAVALGFNRVETALVSGTITWDVLESPSTLNNEGLTWYLALGYTTTGQGTFWACTFEQWDATNNLASQFPPNTASLTPGAQFQNTQAAAALPSTGTTIFNRSATIAQSDTYWYSLTPERLAVFATQGATTTIRMAWYLGLYDRFLSATDDPFPLVFCVFSSQSSSTNNNSVAASNAAGSASREPKQTAATTPNFFAGIYSGSSTQYHPWNTVGFGTGGSVETYSGLPLVSRLILWGRDGSGTTGTPSALRGLLKDMWWATSPVTNTPGTEIDWTFGGTTYTAVKMRDGNASANNIYMGKV